MNLFKWLVCWIVLNLIFWAILSLVKDALITTSGKELFEVRDIRQDAFFLLNVVFVLYSVHQQQLHRKSETISTVRYGDLKFVISEEDSLPVAKTNLNIIDVPRHYVEKLGFETAAFEADVNTKSRDLSRGTLTIVALYVGVLAATMILIIRFNLHTAFLFPVVIGFFSLPAVINTAESEATQGTEMELIQSESDRQMTLKMLEYKIEWYEKTASRRLCNWITLKGLKARRVAVLELKDKTDRQ